MVAKKSKESTELPNPRISHEKQLDIVMAFVAYYKETGEAAGRADIAPIVDLTVTNVSRCLSFWSSIGVLEEVEKGMYCPSAILLEEFTEDGTDIKDAIQSLIRGSWLFSVVNMKMKLQNQLGEEEIIALISSFYEAKQKEKPKPRSVQLAIEIMDKSGVLRREGDLFQLPPVKEGIQKEGMKEPVEVTPDKDLVLFRIGTELWSIERNRLVDFLRNEGEATTEEIEVKSR